MGQHAVGTRITGRTLMWFATYRTPEGERAAVRFGGETYDLEAVAAAAGLRVPATLQAFIEQGALERFRAAVGARSTPPVAPLRNLQISVPYARPPKIWGIGLNYRAHARDLGVAVPDEPASFMKPWTTIIGPGETIRLPPQSQRVTAEAELGLVLGRRCVEVTERDASAALFGYVPVVDMTAEDILQKNPRFLTRSKSFATFLSLGPWIATVDEVADLPGLRVTTARNGEAAATNTISDMRFSPPALVAFFSRVFEFEPGDLVLTGTPGAAMIEDGDEVACRLEGFPELRNPVRRRSTG